jgi:hypothetical protein
MAPHWTGFLVALPALLLSLLSVGLAAFAILEVCDTGNPLWLALALPFAVALSL